MIVGLTGATGHLGGLLLARLLAHPEVAAVRSVARRPLPATRAPVAARGGRLTHVTADLRSADARAALGRVDVLYHLGFQLWSRGGLRAMADVNLAGTANVLAARPARVVFASSAAVYGAWADNPLPIDEGHPPRPNPQCAYALHKHLAERLCCDAATAVVLRIGAVLGRHADAAVARSVRGYRTAVPAIRGVRQAVQFVDEDDAVDAVVAAGDGLIAGRVSAGEVANVATSDWLSADAIGAITGARVVALPRRALLAASEVTRRIGIAPFGADRAVLLGGPLALDPARATRTLEWTARRTSAEVLAAAVGG